MQNKDRRVWRALAALPFVVLVAACAQEQTMTVTATAYNSTPAQTDGRPNETAWGDRLEPGMKVIAVSPDLVKQGLDHGTRVRIEGLDGSWTVLDRTNSRHRRRIDIYMGKDVKAAREWGRKEVTIRWRE
jgi:3D (Asp-Asp-Asp) domain-containing protein